VPQFFITNQPRRTELPRTEVLQDGVVVIQPTALMLNCGTEQLPSPLFLREKGWGWGFLIRWHSLSALI